jgi:hypothetical protein
MPQYLSRAYKPLYVETPLWVDDRKSLCPELSVDGERHVDTGLVSATGGPIYRVQDPIGFGRDDD